ncbi:PREDICTED: anther-specific protein LAT52-like [Ipomoea nil]|uniref:anther-specific protein LAT52-like n=1 Tax=Ipomoea nil TaxID=35883 RepID=UPI000901D205|nr:PREDICTED: anther-specific protein LAT52-like [Ipomoea nil]XP_019176924.1 PREDICTED: anther-specific protein LAT52-like [Ipomoea nil]XP_019176925.1 PREDICTED: anther-specific protein LAT52-like [Ipomoea nil]
MARAVALISAFCILALAGIAHCAPEKFNVVGKVYCDTCRVQFETRISQSIKDAAVRLECRNLDNKTLTYSMEGATGADGNYNLTVDGDHERDMCVVTVVKSPREDCKETVKGLEKAIVVCTANVGMKSDIRHANPLFFMKDLADERCSKVLEEIDFLPGQTM